MSYSNADLKKQQCLIEQTKADPDAFGIIFDTHYHMILRYTTRRTGDVSVAQDITSEVFFKALKNIQKFTWQGVPISAWLYRIATNELRMYYRTTKYTTSLDELRENSDFEPIEERDFVKELEQAQFEIDRQNEFILAQKLIDQLRIPYQEVIALRFGEKKKISEIAEILGKREGTVKSLLSRAMKKLSQEMQKSSRNVQPTNMTSIIKDEGQNIMKPQDEYER